MMFAEIKQKPFLAFNFAVLTLAGLFVLIFLVKEVAHFYNVGVNESDSEPEGLYLQTPIKKIALGSMLSLALPGDSFVFKRGYIEPTTEILKRVGATPGQYLWTRNRVQYVCDHATFSEHCRALGQCLKKDSKGRDMPCQQWQGAQIPANYYYMYSTRVPNSVDSRYFGLIAKSQLTHQDTLLWEFS